MSPSINGGRSWDYSWPNTSIKLWEEAIEVLFTTFHAGLGDQAKLALYHLHKPNPEPMRILFENALADPENPLRKMTSKKIKDAFRIHAGYAADELRRLGRPDNTAELDAARKGIFARPEGYGDCPGREGIFAQVKLARKPPFRKSR
jgi:hypothetical protein